MAYVLTRLGCLLGVDRTLAGRIRAAQVRAENMQSSVVGSGWTGKKERKAITHFQVHVWNNCWSNGLGNYVGVTCASLACWWGVHLLQNSNKKICD